MAVVMAVDKRTLILDAAEAVFAEHGLAGGTIDQITARAGVAKGTFYLYFRRKDDVVAALQERLWSEMVELMTTAADRLATEDFWAVTDEFMAMVIDFDIAHRDWHRMVWQGWGSADTEHADREHTSSA